MTWIIGRSGPFGHAIGISDVRVTISNGQEYDCLQKVYAIAPNMVMGFAGSVDIGLKMVSQLQYEVNIESDGKLINPLAILKDFQIGFKKLFLGFSEKYKRLGCHLMILSAHPTMNDGAAP